LVLIRSERMTNEQSIVALCLFVQYCGS
jgi:hypothetical protein